MHHPEAKLLDHNTCPTPPSCGTQALAHLDVVRCAGAAARTRRRGGGLRKRLRRHTSKGPNFEGAATALAAKIAALSLAAAAVAIAAATLAFAAAAVAITTASLAEPPAAAAAAACLLHAEERHPFMGRCRRRLPGGGPAAGNRAVRSGKRAAAHRFDWQ